MTDLCASHVANVDSQGTTPSAVTTIRHRSTRRRRRSTTRRRRRPRNLHPTRPSASERRKPRKSENSTTRRQLRAPTTMTKVTCALGGCSSRWRGGRLDRKSNDADRAPAASQRQTPTLHKRRRCHGPCSRTSTRICWCGCARRKLSLIRRTRGAAPTKTVLDLRRRVSPRRRSRAGRLRQPTIVSYAILVNKQANGRCLHRVFDAHSVNTGSAPAASARGSRRRKRPVHRFD